MVRVESGHRIFSNPIDSREIRRRRSAYLKVVGKLPPANQELLNFFFASTLLEADRYAIYRNDPDKRRDLQTELSTMGLNDRGISIVMRYFNLPMVNDL